MSAVSLDPLITNKSSMQRPCLTPFQRRVYAYTKKIPKGQVSTYKRIAEAIGCPGSSRAVGTALSKNPFAPIVPCHRVIASNGEIGGFMGCVGRSPTAKNKIILLQSEGIAIENGRLSKTRGYGESITMTPCGSIGPDEITDESLAQII